ncbi:MAG: hypothetical protein R2822_10055 [Spirosomataceae bacterium]
MPPTITPPEPAAETVKIEIIAPATPKIGEKTAAGFLSINDFGCTSESTGITAMCFGKVGLASFVM